MDDPNKSAHERRPGPGHETTDINVWAVGKSGIALAVVCVASIFLLIGVFRYFDTRYPLGATVDPEKTFPSPILEKDEPKNLGEIRAGEDKVLSSYAWVDPQKGVVRIPIDQAIDLVAKRGLPARQQAATQARTMSMPTESGLGLPGEGPAGPEPKSEQSSTYAGKSYPAEVHVQEGSQGKKK